ncbi:MAG: NAD(+) synthase [Flavobacteriales bacterium]|nr:MAG: NAD(+) synthase [Flavobacteriales bacterium]
MNVKKVNTHIVNWLKDYAQQARVNGFVIGISGGIDSAVTASLCAQTGMEVLLLEMPIHQSERQVNRGRELIKKLQNDYPGVRTEEIDLTQTFETYIKAVHKTDNADKVALALANTRARLRMTTLYYYAGLHGLLVAGTGNKVEDFGVGFFTKYGDGGVDLSPIADLMKSEVYALAKYLEVPQSIQEAAPTDGLFGDNRTDEDQIGASYDELEWAMNFIAANETTNTLTDRELFVLELYKKRHRQNLHKMIPIPVCEIPESFK